MPGEIEDWIGELFPIQRRFQIQIDARAPFRNGMRQRRFADLPRAEQRNRRKMAQPFVDQRVDATRYHPCNYAIAFQICKVGRERWLNRSWTGERMRRGINLANLP